MEGIATLADVQRLEASGLPADLPRSTYEMIQRGAAIDPGAPALSFFLRVAEHRNPERWTYAQLLAGITQTANLFHSLGATKDSVIAFVLPNLPEAHFVIWGAEATGIVFAVNPLLEPRAIAELLRGANASILVTLAAFPGTDLWPKLQPVLAEVPSLQHVLLVNLAERVRGLAHHAARLLQKREVLRLHGLRRPLPRRVQLHDFERARRAQPADRLHSTRAIDPDDYSSFFCTGGTTGLPKIAMRRHRNEVANAHSGIQCLGGGIGTYKNVFCGLPLFHVNGVMVTGLLPFSCGAHVIIGTPQGYRGEGLVQRFWEIVEHHRIHFFSAVPTLYASLLQVPIGAHKLDSLEYGLCGAAPMPVQVFSDFQARTGLKILEGYGLTEATCVSSVNPPLGERRLGSIGLRVPGQQMKAVQLGEAGEYLRDCAPMEVGAIVIAGPNVFAGYLAREQNERLFVEAGGGQRWLDTGDLGYADEEGYFWLTGRKKELIIRGGHNIDPALIEAPLHQHPAVQLAAAIGRPDAHAGELPVAYVQLKPGAQASEAELLQFLAEHIAERAALPKRLQIVQQLPLTAIGKIAKPALKRLEVADVLRGALQEAGVEVVQLDVDESARGTLVRAVLRDRAQEAAAQAVLGRYPFAFSCVAA
ncbi:MAG TPA: acyl-CoA synthetase [Polyangiales bacterium]|nr:acyl-CoA synthetase [Polyangiales bacterium]